MDTVEDTAGKVDEAAAERVPFGREARAAYPSTSSGDATLPNSPAVSVEGRPTRIVLFDESERHLGKYINVDAVVQAMQPIIAKFIDLLLDHADPLSWKSNSTSNELSIQIPWSQGNVESLDTYNRVMAQLTNRDFAKKKVPHYSVVDVGPSPHIDAQTVDEQLARIIEKWDQRGPHGFGDH